MAQGKRRGPAPKPERARALRRSQVEASEIERLEGLLKSGAPASGTSPLDLASAGTTPNASEWATSKAFDGYPLSRYTQEGLAAAKYVQPTAIQRAVIPHALAGRDILAAAKTGSGKTLAFLLPILEDLFRARWTRFDGLGALVISPTRELAMQIFDELRKVGPRHELSAGVLVGGKDVAEEKTRVQGLNILVTTPGRLLQHMDETAGFDCSTLRTLVLDEADRILDMGFSAALNAILANLPRQRQTMLFSATQTKSVEALARLSLRDPEYLAVHEKAEAPTPVRLQQAYMVVNLQDKTNILWSFIRTHLQARVAYCKIIIFLSTCKQVRFYFELFRRLRPGVPLRALHGKMSQAKRMDVFYEFNDARAAVLFATDIAARGLDFPAVHWVLQADCPDDCAAYIHRVGRTARYTAAGKGLLLLLPSEREGMLAALQGARVPIRELRQNPDKVQSVLPAVQAMLSKDHELKLAAHRAFVAYVRSVHKHGSSRVFDAAKLPVAEYAASLGLLATPRLRFVRRGAAGDDEDEEDEEERAAPLAHHQAAPARPRSREPDEPASDEGAASDGDAGTDDEAQSAADSEDEFLVVKRRHAAEADQEEPDSQAPDAPGDSADALPMTTTASKKKKKLKIRVDRPVAGSAKIVFDEEGEAIDPLARLAAGAGSNGDEPATLEEHAAALRERMALADARDKADARKRRKEARETKRAKRLAREQSPDAGVELGEDAESESEGEAEAFGGRFRAGMVAELREGAGAEAAHRDMAPAEPATLEDQEALALRLLASRRA